MIKVVFQFDNDIKPVDTEPAYRCIEAVNQRFKVNGTIGVRIAGEHTVQELNRTHAGNNYATDVLSFPYLDIEEGELYKTEDAEDIGELGDIIISREHVTKQAKQASTDEATELALLTLHGILHILGFNHDTAENRATMENLQQNFMGKASLTYRNFSWQDI